MRVDGRGDEVSAGHAFLKIVRRLCVSEETGSQQISRRLNKLSLIRGQR